MQLACLVCDQVVDFSLASEVRDSDHQSVRSGVVRNPPLASEKVLFQSKKAAFSTGKRGQKTQQSSGSSQASRCSVCDGFYHTTCVLKLVSAAESAELALGAPFQCTKCRSETKEASTKTNSVQHSTVLPLLVPQQALPYLKMENSLQNGEKTMEELKTMDNEEEKLLDMERGHWRVLSTSVEVCMTCRQVEIVDADRGSCGKCSKARLHLRCVQGQTNQPVETQVTDRSSRKRRRAPSAAQAKAPALPPPVGADASKWCASCVLETDGQVEQQVGGSVETRTIALLVQAPADSQVEWWKICHVCKERFCLEEFCDSQTTDLSLDEVLLKAPLTEDDADWSCGHCAVGTLRADDLVTVLICDGCDGEFDLAALDPPLLEAPDGDWFCGACSANVSEQASGSVKPPMEVVTVLICDGCDSEFDMANIVPPLANVPEGDWFCNNCVAASSKFTNVKTPDNATLVPVTLLICDVCEGEFDMAALDPPLTEVPSGNWFCSVCTAKHPGKTRRFRNKVVMPKRGTQSNANLAAVGALSTQPAPLSQIGGQQEVMTVLICDGCEREFVPSALNPPVLKIPEGDWFCPTCSAAKASDIQTCAGCDIKFQAGGSAAGRLHRRSGTVDGVMLCEACRNVQVDYTRRRSTPTVNSVPGANDIAGHSVATAGLSRKRNRLGEANEIQKKVKTGSNSLPLTASSSSLIEPATSQRAPHSVSVDDDSFPRIPVPNPVTIVASSVSLRNDFDRAKTSNGWDFTNPTVVVANPGDIIATSNISDGETEDDVIYIVCDVCFKEFKMADVLGTGDASAIPARPWYCAPCFRGLKRNRKRRKRFSQQMVLEMQVYGRLLRPTAAKVVDLNTAASLGKPPNSRDGQRKLYELVGKSVGVFLQWDKQWAMGRVMAFQATHPAMHHIVHFDDGVVASLPLYAFPLVIGTRTMLYVKVPALQNRWWPAQVLRLNQLARNLLLPTHDEEISARINFRLVRIFANNGKHVETTQYVSCWVPKYLCRSMKRFVPPPPEELATAEAMENANSTLEKSLERANGETQAETSCLDCAFQHLLTSFRQTMKPILVEQPVKGVKPTDKNSSDSTRYCAQIAEALVAKTIVVTTVGSNNQDLPPGIYTVNSFDESSRRHTILSQNSSKGNTEKAVDLLCGSDKIVYHFEDPVAFSELAIMLEVSGPDARNNIPGEFYSKELLEKAIVRETGAGSSKSVSASSIRVDNEGEYPDRTCNSCMLGPEELQEDAIDANGTGSNGDLEEELVVCAKCDRCFHATCCDPPHAPISLMNPENGEVLVSDLKIPFVCSDCTLCAGCHCQPQTDKQTVAVASGSQDDYQHTNNGNAELETDRNFNHRWSQWRLPLQAAALCAQCIPYYKTNRFCSVCDLVLDDDQLATNVDLLTCSTCNHWVHAECEPDPHPAFHTLTSNSEFALDVIVDVSDIQSSVLKSGGKMGTTSVITPVRRESDSQAITSLKTPVGSRCPSEDRDMLPNTKGASNRDEGIAKPAKMAEEEFAHSLQFSTTYDPKVLHNYECLTCRKVRMLHVLHRLGREDKLDLFKEPVTEAIAPTYFDVIKSPMDLSTMRHNILDGKYARVNFRGFRDDFELMCLNAVTFNSKERDFLIWREAWRFYGQGQRIFRQTAPKARMKQRGGRHYDSLLVAAKRQLPNNSALAGGKKQSNGDPLGDDGDNEDDDDIDDEEDGDTGSDAGSEAQSRGNTSMHNDNSGVTQSLGLASTLTSEAASADSDTNSNLPESTGEPTRDLAAVGSTIDSVSSSVATTSENRQIVASDAIAFQTILRTDKPSSGLPMFQITQSGPSAHTYCWVDMCAVCGSAGLEDEFVFCVDCGEGFHSFCVPGMSASRLEDNDQLRAYWRCPNCKMCEICGQPGCVGGTANKSSSVPATAGNVENKGSTEQQNGTATNASVALTKSEQLVVCAHCDRSYHGLCLSPAIDLSTHFKNKKREGATSAPAIYCASCVTCTNCASNHVEGDKDQLATLERTYSYARDTCFRCYDLKEREAQALLQRTRALTQIWTAAARKRKIDAEKCPLCERKWDADHEELMQCDACDCWVHPPCDALLKAEPKRYQKLVNDSNAVYICAACRPKEREHLTGKVLGGDGWRCQLLIDNIQRKRSQCESSWNEARAQLEQIEHWKRLADHTSVYLYVLRLGEECLRNFSFRSLNFQGDWSRLTKQQELDGAGLVLPEWLMRKASRYLRFKRYVRGPRAASRRRKRKTHSFYSKQGVGLNTQKDASAICPIVSEAASCAALLACVHLLYGWRPLPEVVLYLLSSDQDKAKGLGTSERQKLGEPLLRRLRMGENNDTDTSKPRMTLEQEITAIKEQYDRRVAKRHLVREPDSDLTLFGFGDVAAETKASATSPKSAAKQPEEKEAVASPVDSKKTRTAISPNVKPDDDGQSLITTVSAQPSARRLQRSIVHLTTVSPLQGWPTNMPEISDDDDSAVEMDTGGSSELITPAPFEDSRFCALCYMIGDNTACGRLLYTESETWVHVNCALWSMEVFEDVSGVLHKVQKAKNRSRLIRCDACGLMGATVGCSILRCAMHYHFPCAVDAGVAFLPNGETCCPLASHLDAVARRLEVEDKFTTGKPSVAPTIIDVVDASNETDNGDGHTGTSTANMVAENGKALTPANDDLVNSMSGSAEEEDKDGRSSTESVASASESITTNKDDQSTISSTSEGEIVVKVENAIILNQQVDSNDIVTVTKPIPVIQSEHVLPVINPRPEPRRSLFSDPPIIVVDVRKKRLDAKRGIKPRLMCYRVGALTVHTLGHVFVGNTSFHTRVAIYPLGFRSSRIFWSTRHLAKRCLYECVISSTEIEERRARQKERGANSREGDDNDSVQQRCRPRAVFKIIPSDDKDRPIVASSAEDALIELRSRVVALYEEHKSFSASPRGSEQGQGSAVVETERNPFLKRSSWFSFALSGDYFFGFGLPEITRYIEELPYAATAAVSRRAIVRKLQQQQQRQGQSPLAASSATTWASASRKRSHDIMELSSAAEVTSALPDVEEDEKPYEFSQVLPSAEEFQTAQRVMEQLVRAEQRARQSSGSARTDGFEGNRLFGVPKKLKAMPRRQALNKEATNEPVAGAANGSGGSGGVAMDLEHLPITMQYRELRRRPFDERLLVRKSSIHGYGLFLKEPVSEGQMIVEYQGHMIGQRVADERERRYEEQGVGSCYMFRLDENTIIDATRCGNLARFINHSCDPKAFARVVSVEGGEKKIVIFAKRAIAVGDEVTYDYKFPIEDEAIRCDCNAPNCIGRMN